MEWNDYLVPCLAAAAGGGINAVAGGGTLLTFPALRAALGQDPAIGHEAAGVWANATSTVALFPASVTAIWGYRQELQTYGRWMNVLVWPSLAGGVVGAGLLMVLPPESFNVVVPWLILIAAVLFTSQPWIARWIGIGHPHSLPTTGTLVCVVLFQFVVGIYGGYFGAGIGILMLSALAMMGMVDIHAMNGLKSMLGSCINGVAVVVFLYSGKVYWPLALSMAVAAGIGGYATARIARRLNRGHVRWFVIAYAFGLAAFEFYRRYA